MNTIYSPAQVGTHNHSPPAVFRHEEEVKKLEKLVDATHSVLMKTKTVFPFDLFPDEVTIDENKINIVFREFFFSEDVHSIMIHLIKDVEVETSLLFGTIKIVPDGYPAQPIYVRYLKKSDALKIRRIIQGLMLSKKEGIDTTKLDEGELKEKVELVGHMRTYGL